MAEKPFLHQLDDFEALIRAANEKYGVQNPGLVEKDYWIMHCLYGLQQAGYAFYLKGGTSLSKGYGLIHRFSEDIDLQIDPPEGREVYAGKNHDKPQHVKSRADYYDYLADNISIVGITAKRDHEFDDADEYRSGGIRLEYESLFASIPEIKDGILLEAGFAQIAPNRVKTITSWAFEHAIASGVDVADNRAPNVPCYEPGYTLVEKLQAIGRKYRQYKEGKALPTNFMRHYYDVHCLLSEPSVREFTVTEEFDNHVANCFTQTEQKTPMEQNPAFLLDDKQDRELFRKEYEAKRTLYFKGQPDFGDVIETIRGWVAEKYDV